MRHAFLNILAMSLVSFDKENLPDLASVGAVLDNVSAPSMSDRHGLVLQNHVVAHLRGAEVVASCVADKPTGTGEDVVRNVRQSVDSNFDRSLSFWEQTLRRKKSSSWKVQEMKVLLQLRGLETKGRKLVLQDRVKALLYPQNSASAADIDDACGSNGSTSTPPSLLVVAAKSSHF